MKPLLTLSYFVNLVLAGTIGWLFLRGDVADMKPVDVEPEAVAVSEEIIAVSELAELSEERVEPVQSERPNLNELDTWEQVAVLTAEGWSEEDAKMYALGAASLDGFKKIASLMGNDDEYQKDADMMDVYLENEKTFTEMQRRMEEVSLELFGRDVNSRSHGMSPISEEKKKAAALIEQDYQAMQMKLYQDQKGISLPEDEEALALLEEAKQQDLKALFTPDELFEFEIRSGTTETYQLRSQLALVEPTETEFREIYRLNQEKDLEGTEDSIREVLGEERYRIYERSEDWGYGRLFQLTERLDLPRERVDEVYDVKESVEKRREDLQEKTDLSDEDRQAAFKALKKETDQELKDLLGEKGLEVYRESVGYWLHGL